MNVNGKNDEGIIKRCEQVKEKEKGRELHGYVELCSLGRNKAIYFVYFVCSCWFFFSFHSFNGDIFKWQNVGRIYSLDRNSLRDHQAVNHSYA